MAGPAHETELRAFRKAERKLRNKRLRKERLHEEEQIDPESAAADKRERQRRATTRNDLLRAFLANLVRRPIGKALIAERLLLIDVGARGGLPLEWEKATPLLRVIGFEPELKHGAGYELLDYPMEFVTKAVASTAGRVPFYRTQSGYASSLLMPVPGISDRFSDLEGLRSPRALTVETTTLDDVARERGLAFVDMLKLDTQGSELDILQGGRETLARLVFGVITEVEFMRLYENQPLFTDIDLFVRAHGFELATLSSLRRHLRKSARFDELGLSRANGQVLVADAMYFRSPEHVVTLLGGLDAPARFRYLVGAILVCLIYQHADYAAYLIECTAPFFAEEVVEELYGVVAGYQRTLTAPLEEAAVDPVAP